MMKIEEFKEIIDTIGFYKKLNLEVEEDDFDFLIKLNHKTCATVSKSTLYCIDTYYKNFEELSDNVRANLLDVMNKLAETPPEERKDEKKYYLRHKLLYGGSINYLNLDNSTKWWKLNNKSQNDYTQTQFTQEEIDGIKKGYDVDLKDFEIIEVEDETTSKI
ncbi:hypothetical protein [Peptoniphilus vaginalis]|uniref:hypothetical protein n=1 Tax=Peptoniphilus vaginalis TaxID=1756987 RepID=UPI0023F9AAF5|nr:hypothetical protein [Peptoniphilus vaginalis]